MIEAVRVILSLLLVIGLLTSVLRSRYFKNRMLRNRAIDTIHIKYKKKLSAQTQLALISIEKTDYLLGLTANSMVLLKEFAGGVGHGSELYDRENPGIKAEVDR